MSGSLPPLVAVVDFGHQTDPMGSRRRIFRAPAAQLRATRLDEVVATIDRAEQLALEGRWVVGFVAYEAARAFDPAFATPGAPVVPLAWFAAFDDCTEEQMSTFGPGGATVRVGGDESPAELEPETDVAPGEYEESVARIRELVAAGDVYQVNLTVPYRSRSTAAPFELYERMRLAQAGCYSAFLDLGDIQIMSASPELFFERRGAMLRSRPMKGTSRRGLSVAADSEARERLLRSEKDRAENVMIVDVVRNDLGRIAQLGSVAVRSLCVAERYPSVWQLTSTVECAIPRDLPLSGIFQALFPAASITGAPKIRATAIISELEAGPRGVYCGAVGMIAPDGSSQFNVAIRTAWTPDRGRTVHLNAGGGVTIDSTAAGELAEVRDKVVAFTRASLRPTLLETIRIERGVPRRLDRHLARISASAEYFGTPFDGALATALLAAAARAGGSDPLSRGRLLLSPDGATRATVEPFRDDSAADHPRDLDAVAPERRVPLARPVSLARRPVDQHDVRLYHKTMSREVYDHARAGDEAAFDVLLWNHAGEVTEFTRGNVVVELAGRRWTPPQHCGLLAGVLRSEILEQGLVEERAVRVSELRSASRIWFVNALRGWVGVHLVGGASGGGSPGRP